MDGEAAPLIGLLRARLSWLAQRQRVLAENIANADTPQFRPLDLEPFAARPSDRAGGTAAGLVRTHPSHVAAGPDPRAYAQERQRRPWEVSPAGNAVVLDEQMAKLSQTAIDHKLATQLYRKYLGFIRTVASAKG